MLPLLKTFSWLHLTQLSTNSSPQPLRFDKIWLLLLLCCTHSDPAKPNFLLLFEHHRHAPNFALAVPHYWNTLLPHDMPHSLTSQIFFQMSLSQTHHDHPTQSATSTPYSPSLLYFSPECILAN